MERHFHFQRQYENSQQYKTFKSPSTSPSLFIQYLIWGHENDSDTPGEEINNSYIFWTAPLRLEFNAVRGLFGKPIHEVLSSDAEKYWLFNFVLQKIQLSVYLNYFFKGKGLWVSIVFNISS